MDKPVPQLFVETLIEAGITHVFGMPGGCTPAFYDGLAHAGDHITTTLARHEGGAAVMADAYARCTGKPACLVGQGAWVATSGGFGIIESYSSGVPVLIVCDISDYQSLPLHGPYQNGSGDYGAFDVPAMLKAMTKFTTVASTPGEFVHGLRLAIKHAVSGRPGPAAVAVKWNVPFAVADPDALSPPLYPLAGHLRAEGPALDAAAADRIAEVLAEAQSPVLVLGQGARWSRAGAAAARLCERLGMPAVTSLLGKGAIAETHLAALGVMGSLGQHGANRAVTEADVLLAVGTSLAPDNTKWLSPSYINGRTKKIIQIDIEPRSVGWTFPVHIGAIADAVKALEAIDLALESRDVRVAEALDILSRRKAEARSFRIEELPAAIDSPVAPERVVHEVQRVLHPEDLIVVDGGNNRMWFTHYFQTQSEGQMIIGGGVAAMGYAPSAALAVQIASPDRRVFAVVGDGGLLMAAHALESARDLRLPIVFLVLNNAMLGNVYDYQPEGRKIASTYSRPNLAGMAAGLGLSSLKVETGDELRAALSEARLAAGPFLIDCSVRPDPHFKLMDEPPALAGRPSEG